ncbi:MAG: 4-alpha-glucanotransferase [Dehalococcoidales bacterium]|jgi:4-alpha-glucanotransferase
METARMKLQLGQLARLYNVQTAYLNIDRFLEPAAPESLLAILKALGAPVITEKDIPAAIRERKLSLRRQPVEPVTIAWDGARPAVKMNCPAPLADAPVTCRLETESGERTEWPVPPDAMKVLSGTDVEGISYLTREITLTRGLPYGYHRLTLDMKGNSCRTQIIAAPQKTFTPEGPDERRWGTFIPLYALRGKDSWGSGDYRALGELADWVGGKGGSVLATLPLLPLYLDEPYEASPYAPVSRLLWSEFYVDIAGLPELDDCPAARSLVNSDAFRGEIARLRQNPLVDYRGVMALKRRAMEEMCRCLLNRPGARRDEFLRFVRENPLVERYAAFRAVMEKREAPWPAWPQTLRDGNITPGDYDDNVKDYQLYAQWLAHRQVEELSVNARAKGMKMYFDLPLGVHAAGFDVWQHRDSFVAGVTAGAPPDAVFTGGQDWYCPPLHPENIRRDGYQYVRDYLRHNLQYADILRVDHVMGLHRLFWIPPGGDAGRGVYVKYHAEELYAVLCLESHCHQCVIVGEDLGMVPGYVRKSMSRHGLDRMYVLYYELAEDASKAMHAIAPSTVASLNTHDMSPFAAFWDGDDIKERLNMGLTDAAGAVEERKHRRVVKNSLTNFLRQKKFLAKAASGTRAALSACLAYLSASRSRTVLVNLEDLWLEKRSQNVPGVGEKYPSWRRKACYTLKEFSNDKDVSAALAGVDRRRKHRMEREG